MKSIDLRRLYEEEGASDEEIRKQALLTAADLLKKEQHPTVLYCEYASAAIQAYMEHILRDIKNGLLSISIAADILGLSEENVQEMIDDNTKIEEYHADVNIPDELERTLEMVDQNIFRFSLVKNILDRTCDLLKKGSLSVDDAAYICDLEVDEYTAYVRTVHNVDTSVPVNSNDKKITITFDKDEAANVWVVTSDDVPGLVLEADTFEKAVRRLDAIPELWKMNFNKDIE